MSDERHKKSPPDLESEDNTETFRNEARRALDNNDEYNRLRGLKRGQHGYKISSQAELATALSERFGREVSRRMVQKILGGVHAETKVDLVEDSVYIPAIRELLELVPVTRISVRTPRAAIVQFIAELPEDKFEIYEKAVREQMQKRK